MVFSSQVGTSVWIMNLEQAAGSSFPRCTWRPVRALYLQCEPWWSYRPAILERAVTERPILRSLFRSSVVRPTSAQIIPVSPGLTQLGLLIQFTNFTIYYRNAQNYSLGNRDAQY